MTLQHCKHGECISNEDLKNIQCMSNSLEEILSQTYIITCVEMCILSREPFKKTTRARGEIHWDVCVCVGYILKGLFACAATASSWLLLVLI